MNRPIINSSFGTYSTESIPEGDIAANPSGLLINLLYVRVSTRCRDLIQEVKDLLKKVASYCYLARIYFADDVSCKNVVGSILESIEVCGWYV